MTVYDYLQFALTHLVPLLFFAGGGILLLSPVIQIFSPLLDLFHPLVATAVGIFYFILGVGYEWTIKREREINEWYRQQKRLLDEQREKINDH
jgi:hypothetical protein